MGNAVVGQYNCWANAMFSLFNFSPGHASVIVLCDYATVIVL